MDVLDKLDTNGVSIFNFKEHSFGGREPILMIIYLKQFGQMQEFLSDVAILISKKVFNS